MNAHNLAAFPVGTRGHADMDPGKILTVVCAGFCRQLLTLLSADKTTPLCETRKAHFCLN